MPKNTKQVFGQDLAVSQLRDYVLNYKSKKNKAALLHGPIGIGKTSSVYALANELGYELLELNSSDLRNSESIRIFLDSTLGQQSLFFKPKIVLIDEVDNISGRSDRGCIPALIKGIAKSSFPVIATANDITNSKLKSFVKAAQQIEYMQLTHNDIAHLIGWVCEQEGIKAGDKAVNTLARRVDGDARAALLDMHSLREDFSFEQVLTLTDRKRTDTIMNALRIIFKSSSAENARTALRDVDVDINQVFLWIDYNLPKEYVDATSLSRAYEYISKADIFRRRISRQQHWRFLSYINDLLTAGVAMAKEQKNTEFIKYKRTMRLLRIWQMNMKLAKKKEIAKKLANAMHVSSRVANEYVGYYQKMFKHSECTEIAHELELSSDEVAWLRK